MDNYKEMKSVDVPLNNISNIDDFTIDLIASATLKWLSRNKKFWFDELQY